MVNGVNFYASTEDLDDLTSYLGIGHSTALYPWPVIAPDRRTLTLDEALTLPQVMIESTELGAPILASGPAYNGNRRSAVFNRINRERLLVGNDEAQLVDSDRSPVMVWQPAAQSVDQLRPHSIGSQAESPEAISSEYAKWVRNFQSWVRRRGARVWGLEQAALRPDLDITLPIVSSVYALPGALALLDGGTPGR